MSTAATTSYNLSAQDMIDMALADIGVNGPEGLPNANLRPLGLKHLNLVLKRLAVEGAFTWRIQRRTQALTSGTSSYVLSNDVDDIDQPARYTASGATYGSWVTPMVRDEYMTLPDRTIQGVPSRYYVEKSLGTDGIEFITLFLYPVPPNTGDSLEYAAVIRAKDVTSLTQTLDIPQKWLQAVRFGLAASLCFPFGVPVDRSTQFGKMFDSEIEKALNEDNEHGDINIVPFGTTYAYGGLSSNSRYR
jgi:hypothetical protein